jgi:3',5'-cyclic AMP phosphodiesterase CpdA
MRITRRSALAAAGAAFVSQFARGQQTQPAKPREDTFTFALITDTHLGRGGEKPAEQMRTAVEEINATSAALTICCGDLVNAGEVPGNEKQYPVWAQIAGGLKSPWHAVPGNHDPIEKFTKHIRPQTDFVVDAPNDTPWRFICFRDAKPNPDHQGIVTDAQLNWLDTRLAETKATGRRAFLVAHVIYHENKKPDVGWMIQDNRAAFTELLKNHAPTIAAFFAGHFHSGLRGWDDTFGIHEVVLPSCCWNFDGKRLRGAPGYVYDEDRPAWVLAEATGKTLRLSYRPLGAEVSVVRELQI